MKYKKYFRKSSIKKQELGSLFLEEIQKKNPKSFLEIGIFHGVTARNLCELMYKNHGKEFKYIGIDIFENDEKSKDEVIPNTRAAFLPRYRKLFTEAVEEVVRRIADIAEVKNITPSQLALAWVKSKQVITAPIIGVTSIQHLEDSLGSLDVELSEGDISICESLYEILNSYDPKADRR